MKAKILFLSAILIASIQTLHAKTLIVSDVDDTIKMTDVLGKKRTIVFNGLFREKAFAGMSELYNKMMNEDTSIYYVSGSPKVIRMRVSEFLEENDFPQQHNLLLKDSMSDDTYEYKTTTIKKLIKELNPDRLILIGDDTEYDPQVYEHIKAEYPELSSTIYIRAVSNREGVETSFFTPMEIAGHEFLEGRLDKRAFKAVANGFIKQTNDSGIVLKSRYCPKKGREAIEELKHKIADQDIAELFAKTQKKIIRSCN